MLDQLMVKRAMARDVLVDPSYTPEQAVIGYSDIAPANSRNLVVMFPSWHQHLDDPFYEYYAEGLAEQGFYVRRYDFNDHILEPDIFRVPESFFHIQKTVVRDLVTLTDAREFDRISFRCSSIGTVPMFLVADEFKKVTDATIVAGSSDLANSMTYGIRTAELHRTIEEDGGYSPQTVYRTWRDITPSAHVSAFKDKPTLQIIGIVDRVIHTGFQLDLKFKLAAAGSLTNTQYRELGHYATIAKYLAKPRAEA